ncbi:MAG: hypothetical protein COA78_37445 [Blastopirellula sp.]|nr:MAG: hypothetical protein COA78_37445 [Blastopirellula sp.]
MIYWVFFCTSFLFIILSSAVQATEYSLDDIQLRKPSTINYDRHYDCLDRPELNNVTECILKNITAQNSTHAENLLKSSNGDILYAYKKTRVFGDLNHIVESVTSDLSREMAGAKPTLHSEHKAVFAIWGNTRIEEISTHTGEYREIAGLVEQKYGLLTTTTDDFQSAKDNFLPVYRVIGGDGLVAIFSKSNAGQVLVQRFIVAAGTLVEKNFESQARHFLESDQINPADDFSKWPEAAFLIRRLALSTTPDKANVVVDRTFGVAGNRKYYSHIWAFLPTSVINHLSTMAYTAVDVFGKNTEFPEIRAQMIRQLEALPTEPYSEFLLYTLGQFREAIEFNPRSPIRTVLLYALAHSQLREVMSDVFTKISRHSDRNTLTDRIFDYSFRHDTFNDVPYKEETIVERNKELSEKDFFNGSSYENIPASQDEYNDEQPTLTQYLNYFNKFPERLNSAPIVHTVGSFARLTDSLLPIFEEVARDRKSPHFDDAGYYLGWLTYHRGDVNKALNRFGEVIALQQSGDLDSNFVRLDYTSKALVHINRIFRTLSPQDVFDRIQNSNALSPHPIIWRTALTSFYQSHQHQVVMAGARRALRHFGIRIENLPVTTDPRRIWATFSRLELASDDELHDIVYLFHSSREIRRMEEKLLEIERHANSEIEDELRELISKYSLTSDSDLKKMYSNRNSKPLHRDIRQSLYLLRISLDLLPKSSALSKFRQWLHYKRIRLLAEFDPIRVAAANVDFQNEFPQSTLLDDGLAEQIFAEAVIIGDMARATETFRIIRQRYPNANALDNAHSWMAIGWTCMGQPVRAREIDKQIARLFPLTRHARYARERIQNPQGCTSLSYMWGYRAMQWREKNRIDVVQTALGNRPPPQTATNG